MSRATVKDLYNVMAVDDGARVPRYKLNYLPPPKKKKCVFPGEPGIGRANII